MAIGIRLREAREQAGLTTQQISERTKIALYKIEALENGEFLHLPDGIYLDGIVRAYADELALEPEPLIELLHRERPQVAQDWIAVLKGIYATKQNKGRARAPWKVMRIDLPKGRQGGSERAISRRRHEPAGAARRPGRLAVAFVSLIAAIGWGLYLHEASRAPVDQTVTIERPAEAPTPRDQGSDPLAGTTAPPAPTIPADASASDVSGSWMLVTRVERSRHGGFAGSPLGYEIHLEQAGDRVLGSGWKTTENGRTIGARAQTPISVAGSIHGDRLALTFTESGAKGPTQGKFVLLLDEDGALRGRFSSDVRQSAGTVEAYRLR